jgi:hypothetical protein
LLPTCAEEKETGREEGKEDLDWAAARGVKNGARSVEKKCQKRIRGREIAEKKDNWDSPRAYTQNQRTAGAYL